MKLSIIVPVFNCEKYIKRCFCSIMGAVKGLQGGYEILLIDNGSRDKSVEILKQLAKENPKTVVFEKCEKPGAAAVRNFGVRKARGEYIWFIDGDDEITEKAAVRLVTEADKTNADLVTLGLVKIFPDGNRENIPAVEADDPEFKSKFIRRELGPVQVLIRRKWFISHHFQFLEGGIHEDMDLMPALILYTDRYASVNEPLYLYYQREGSVLHPTRWDQHYFDIFPALQGLYRRFAEIGAEKQYHDELEWFFIWNLLIDSAVYFGEFQEGHAGFLRSRKMLKQYFPAWRKNRFLKRTNLKTRLKILVNYYR